MFKINKKASCTVVLSLLLVGCAGISVQSYNTKQITAQKLADGTPVTMGSIKVQNDWQCQQIGQVDFNAKKIELGAQYTDWDNYNDYLKKQALKYANQQKLEPNYIYHYIPTEASAGLIQNYGSRAQVIYYKCVNPPKANHDIGSVM